jgi:hypothetical protein
MTANGIGFGSDLLTKKAQIFSHLLIHKKSFLGSIWSLGYSITLCNGSIDPYGGYPMVWMQLVWFHDCQLHQLWLRFADQGPNNQSPTAYP